MILKHRYNVSRQQLAFCLGNAKLSSIFIEEFKHFKHSFILNVTPYASPSGFGKMSTDTIGVARA